MDYIAGQSLDLYMAGRPRSIRQTLELFVQICDAANGAHLRGIIHRDLKPANVRVDESGRPFVLDFGLAKLTTAAHGESLAKDFASARTLTGQFLGSLPWAAPEQVEADPAQIDTRTDVYSLGVLLFQMLTAKFPYPATGPIKEAMEAILHTAPMSPRLIRREVDDELEAIVLKCLSKERERRYQTAGELCRDVRRYLEGESIDAKRDSAMYVLRKTLRRYRGPVAGLAALVLLLVVFSGVTWVLWAQARAAAEFARKSEISAREKLRESLVSQARATRQSLRIGRRFEALEAIAKAAAGEPSLEARNEAIAAMALPDLRALLRLKHPGTGYFDRELDRCAVAANDGSITVVRTADDTELGRIPAPASVVSHVVCILSRTARALRTFSRMASALAVHLNALGF